MNIEDALHTFIVECRELLQQMEDALLRIEQTPDDSDTINAIFRAAHTMKGSAGLFGLDHVVAFTHVAESVLDRVRSGELTMDGDLVVLFLKVCDHLNTLVEGIAAAEAPDDTVQGDSRELVMRLEAYLSLSEANAPPKSTTIATVDGQEGLVEREGGDPGEQAGTGNWHLSLRFGPDILRNGMDPLSFLRYLGTFGRIVSIVTLTDGLPPVAEMDPESSYLGFEVSYQSDAGKAAIEDAFEFVREDSQIRILPPGSKICEYLSLIEEMPEENMRLGEILVKCGTLTPFELEHALKRQAESGDFPSPLGVDLVEQHIVSPPVVQAALEKQQQIKDNKSKEAQFIRVDAQKLDEHINRVGELIIAGAAASLLARETGMSQLLEVTATIAALVEDVRDSALSLRMVQIGATLNRFQRVVHDVSRELGKDIDLIISGANTELDKTVVEKIGDPLTHLVRNSMDHGIEAAEERLKRGKPVKGTLRLNAYHDAGSVVIEVSDDGAGLNKDKILRKAQERGLVAREAVLSDKEIYMLIFEPGFSTAETVSNLSGRGVGMDVVRRNIQALRGTVDIESELGAGCLVRIRLPLTLAIIDGFLVGVGDAVYVIPLDMVVECMELNALNALNTDNRYINLRGEVLPYHRLREYFHVDGQPAQREYIVVVRYGEHKAGLVVEKLMGEFQTVIKPLSRLFGKKAGLGGFTILGNGDVALILDIPGIIRQVAEEDAFAREIGRLG